MKANPFEDFEELLERMSDELPIPTKGPRVDLVDEDDRYVLHADLPGFDRDDIDLGLRGRQLTLRAERERDESAEGAHYIRRERERTGYSRTLRLPDPVDADAVEATYENGVLEVSLPKLDGDASHRIDVE